MKKRFTILFLSISIINLAVMPIGNLYFTQTILVQIVDNDHSTGRARLIRTRFIRRFCGMF